MIVSTNCSQLKIAVSCCSERDIKTKVLWVHETDYDFHSSTMHPLGKVLISGLGCNVTLWDNPNTSPVSRDRWDTWDTSKNCVDLHNIDTFRGHGHTVEAVHVSEHDNLICTGATNGSSESLATGSNEGVQVPTNAQIQRLGVCDGP